jgi:hypothetical protein
MQLQPAARYRKLKAGGVFRGRGLVAEQKRAIDFLDVDPTIPEWARRRVRVLEDGGRPSQGRHRVDWSSISQADSHRF